MILVNLTPTNIEFVYNGKIYSIQELIKSGDTGLMIVAEEKLNETPTAVVVGENELIPEK
jgi:Tfp pilus assembly pilus retraction ATPase PilT